MKIIIDDKNEGQRIDFFLASFISELSRSRIQNLIKQGLFTVNKNSTKPSYILKINDLIETKEDTITIINFSTPKPESIELEIVWEDENMAVINKPSNMLTHPTTIEMNNTLVNALLHKYGENLSDINGDLRRGIVHRLDRNTSGLIMIAKNNKTHQYLADEIQKRNFSKKYLAIVKGVLDNDYFSIDKPIGRHPTQPYKQTVRQDGKESLTIVKVLKRYNEASLVELNLVTGRTHQIRVHLASIGHPVYNDTLYGFGKMKIKTEEQVLQAYKLEFTKPFTQEKIFLEIEPDKKIKKVLKHLE